MHLRAIAQILGIERGNSSLSPIPILSDHSFSRRHFYFFSSSVLAGRYEGIEFIRPCLHYFHFDRVISGDDELLSLYSLFMQFHNHFFFDFINVCQIFPRRLCDSNINDVLPFGIFFFMSPHRSL